MKSFSFDAEMSLRLALNRRARWAVSWGQFLRAHCSSCSVAFHEPCVGYASLRTARYVARQ